MHYQFCQAPVLPKSEAISCKTQFPDLFKSLAIEYKSQSFRTFRAPCKSRLKWGIKIGGITTAYRYLLIHASLLSRTDLAQSAS